MKFFASCPIGLEYLLVDELKHLGGDDVHEARAGVHFQGDLEMGYRACLWSRLASRISAQRVAGPVADEDALYQLAAGVDWCKELPAPARLDITASTRHPKLKNSRYVSQRVKDAIVDTLRDAGRERPVVGREGAELALLVVLSRNSAVISVDLMGRSLTARGYRQESGEAPLREDLAAALLLRAGWPAIAEAGGGLVDPLCGSGTLLVEGALMAADVAPGILRSDLQSRWTGHDPAIWQALVEDARRRKATGLSRLDKRFFGYDRDGGVIQKAKRNAERAGVGEFIRFEQRELTRMDRTRAMPQTGLLICNPPYGQRLGDAGLFDLYRLLGSRLQQQWGGWHASVFTAEVELAHAIALKPTSRYKLRNGSLECLLVNFGEIPAGDGSEGRQDNADGQDDEAEDGPREGSLRPLGPGAEMLANRLRKNLKKISKYLKKNNITCYRAYDADLPEYAAAIDVYGRHVHVQEYQAPREIPAATTRRRLSEIVRVVEQVFELPAEAIAVKTRRRQRGDSQYERRTGRDEFFQVTEGGLNFRVNLTSYLDTGLFLDHRETRAMIRERARGKRFLNLFCYTGSVTVYAAAGGARSTTSVDLSQTYLDWARDNLAINAMGGRDHRLIRADCVDWIDQDQGRYELIFVDPPTFSNSKRMQHDFDLQRDHVKLLRACLSHLADGGELFFSNNFRRFEMQTDAFEGFKVEEITRRTLPPDHQRSRSHRCWLMTKARPASSGPR